MFKIMGIDPGSYHIGVSILTLNDKLEITHVESINVEIGNLHKHLCNSDIITRSHNFSLSISDIVYYSNPLLVGIEASFSNRDRPTAVIPLSKILGVLHNVIYTNNKETKIIEIAPLSAKKAINLGNTLSKEDIKDKEKIRELVYNNFELYPFLQNIYLTEHEVDAMAVTYKLLTQIRENPTILITY